MRRPLAAKNSSGFVILQNGVAQAYDFGNSGELVTQKLSNSNDAPGAKIVVQNNIFRSRLGVPVTVLKPFLTSGYTGTALVKSNLKTLLDWNYNLYYTEPGQNLNYDFAAAGFTGNTYNFANYKTETGLDSASAAVELWTPPTIDPVFVGGTEFPGRFALVSSSPAIDIGNPSSSSSGTDDFIYNNRILGGRIDAGALEFVTTGGSVTRIRRESFQEEKVELTLYPNPAVNEVALRFTEKQGSNASIEISDISGHLLFLKTVVVQAGMNTLRINNLRAAGFITGVYFVNLKSSGAQRTFKLLIQ